jgi:hypothetical protein
MKRARSRTLILGLCLVSASVFAGDFDSGSFDTGSFGSESPLSVSGSVSWDEQLFIDGGDGVTNVEARIDLEYAGASSDLAIHLRADPARLEDYSQDLIDEAYMNAFLGNLTVSAGKKKVVWGKGDELHVADLVNANDYGSFIFPQYTDRRIGEAMVQIAWMPGDGSFRLEGIWTPFMTADRLPVSGPWVSSEVSAMESLIRNYVGYTYGVLYGAGGAANSAAATEFLASHSEASAFLPDTMNLEYGQYALRGTGTIGAVDLGASWYLGHFKTPSVTYTVAGPYVTSLSMEYDRLQAFSVDAAAALGPWNFRAEGAYYLTDDVAGDDPWVRNNEILWLAGFDLGLPISSLTLNAQTTGSYVLGSEVEGDRVSNLVVVKLSDSFAHEKIIPSVKTVWDLEGEELLLMPEVELTVRDGMTMTLYGALFMGDEGGIMDAYLDKDYVAVKWNYVF